MKALYKVIYTTNHKKHEFETVIERGDQIPDAELVKALYPKFVEFIESLGDDGSFGTRGGICSLDFEYLGPP
ncbi:hypothetical protein DAI21_17465 [Lelliottia sp. WB101]|uniref:hypothetical protein n=1 Tax=Lelliottia sp. WB101 TaxID=2153385 RepID=UPI000D215528|nr:hypothetical protein [Lelliottia sp. WB101]AVY99312.1 hypothetical protein DAI21_17465 [Lelliottia sp. WB101]